MCLVTSVGGSTRTMSIDAFGAGFAPGFVIAIDRDRKRQRGQTLTFDILRGVE